MSYYRQPYNKYILNSDLQNSHFPLILKSNKETYQERENIESLTNQLKITRDHTSNIKIKNQTLKENIKKLQEQVEILSNQIEIERINLVHQKQTEINNSRIISIQLQEILELKEQNDLPKVDLDYNPAERQIECNIPSEEYPSISEANHFASSSYAKQRLAPFGSRLSYEGINECVVCFEPSTHAIKKCGHFCVCEGCGLSLYICPVCRVEYDPKTDLLKIFM
jgi:hypothetical protein